MKKYLPITCSIILMMLTFSLNAQTINIPDANFKSDLIARGVDTNKDGEIQESEALAITYLDVSEDIQNYNSADDIRDLTGIEYFKNLTYLDFSRNQVASLNTINLTKLTKLFCRSNNLTDLDVSKLLKLTELDCYSNKLTNLDVSILTNITSLNYASNNITNLDVSKLINLTELDCSGNKITNLDVSKLINLTSLNCSFNSLTSLDVSKLTKLTSVQCLYNSLTSLDVSKLLKLTKLNCSKNKITSLNLDNLLELIELDCSINLLTSLDVSSLTGLIKLECSENKLTSLDVSSLTKLEEIKCSGNKLTILNLGSIKNIKKLYCSKNQLSNLNVNNLINLDILDFSSNRLTNINLTTPINLSVLLGRSNLITSLNVDLLTNLFNLYCDSNQITSLNLSNNIKLRSLYCGVNQITSLDVSKLTKLYTLECFNNKITSLDVANLKELMDLNCSFNKLPSLNLNNLTELERIDCSNNLLTSLGLNKLSNLNDLNCSNNLLTNLSIDNSPNLEYLDCNTNNLTSLDVSNSTIIYNLDARKNQFKSLDFNKLTELYYLDITNNSQLEALYIKNGQDDNFYLIDDYYDDVEYYYNILEGNDKLKYICTDNDDAYSLISLVDFLFDYYGEYYDIIISTLCNSTTVGTTNYLMGKVKYDANSDGCNKTDKAFPNIKVKISNTQDSVILISGASGNFSTYLGPGNYTSKPILEHPSYYTVSPQSYSFTLPDTTSPVFCIAPNGVHNDLSVSIIPTVAARPGFSDAKYKVVYKNQGTTTQSGSVTFNYDEAKMNFITSSPIADNKSDGKVSFNFSGLKPFETRSAFITMRTNSPSDNPAVNSGDALEFTAVINGAADETPNDNLATLSQTVVGSFDPNDKTCLEGEIVSPELIGKNVHYLIRFENTGSANAENIVVTDYIDTTVFDINTLQITDASHICHTQISQGNKVQFIFSDIQLPFSEPNKHGHVAFSIKLKDNLVIGDSIQNKADIYFDYNLPVATNKAVSEINYKTITYIGRNNSLQAALDIYPNPSNGQFSLDLKAEINAKVQISIMNVEGKVVFNREINHHQHSLLPLNLKGLSKGVYLIKVRIENDVFSKKVVIQ
jgi:uncharacterized repeat protein (TIGR01451 family)